MGFHSSALFQHHASMPRFQFLNTVAPFSPAYSTNREDISTALLQEVPLELQTADDQRKEIIATALLAPAQLQLLFQVTGSCA